MIVYKNFPLEKDDTFVFIYIQNIYYVIMLYSRVHESTNTFSPRSLHGQRISEAEEEIGKKVIQRS